ncbi:MAG TPA: tRNA cytidylyltransferase, partial [Anaeromyxobacteraceae bacterium]|nr:tRNA cytidylyltransferase [Anaeromyxobacteraceae bacterium]
MTLPAALQRAEIPPPVLAVLRRLGEHGHRSWLVGGIVRDLLHGRARRDPEYDLATPATPREVTALFRKVIPTGIEHGTVTILEGGRTLEVTTFRGEGEYVDGRRPASVTFHGDLEADLARRDFTVNAMAFDPLAGELVDPFGGRADLAARVIRAVGEPAARFGEDGLRPLRAVRFAAQLGFTLHPRTRAAIRGALPVVRRVSAERVCEELSRIVAAPHLGRALLLLDRTGILGAVVPALAALPPAARRHVAALAEALPPDPARPELRLAALLHLLPAADVEPLLSALRFPRKVAADTGALVARHACLRDGPPEDPSAPPAVRRWLAGVGPERLEELLALRDAEVHATSAGGAPRAARRRGARH